MNQSQLKYVRERASKIYSNRKAIINKQPKQLLAKEKIEALVAGAFTVDANKAGAYNWYDAIVFNDQTYPDQDKRKVELAALDEEYTALMDNLYLGDSQEALELLKKFAGEMN